jgi:hypothetical protein
MVRRLKSDLRHFGEKFPERIVEPIELDGLRDDAPELVLSRKLAEYGEIVRARAASLPPQRMLRRPSRKPFRCFQSSTRSLGANGGPSYWI